MLTTEAERIAGPQALDHGDGFLHARRLARLECRSGSRTSRSRRVNEPAPRPSSTPCPSLTRSSVADSFAMTAGCRSRWRAPATPLAAWSSPPLQPRVPYRSPHVVEVVGHVQRRVPERLDLAGSFTPCGPGMLPASGTRNGTDVPQTLEADRFQCRGDGFRLDGSLRSGRCQGCRGSPWLSRRAGRWSIRPWGSHW